MATTPQKYGDKVYNPQTGAYEGTVGYDAATGQKLQSGQYSNTYGNAYNINTGQPIPYSPVVSSPFPVANLNSQPVSLAPTTIPTAAAGGMAAIATQAKSVQDQFLQQQQALVNNSQTNLTTASTGLQSVYDRLFGQPARNEEIYKDLGVDEAKKAVDNFTSQIEAEQNSNQNRIDAIYGNGGITKAQAAPQVNELNRQSISKQADLAVLQGAAARNYDAVASAADRKVQAETESLKIELDARKFFYEQNKDEYDKQEQRLYEQQNQKIETEIENKKAGQAAIVEAVSLGAPASIIQQAQSLYNQGADPITVAKALGQYTAAGLAAQTERLQQANIRSQMSERSAAGNVNGTVNGKPQTATQATAQSYGNRLSDANISIDALGQKFSGTLSQIPLPNFLKSADRQVYEQAEKNFVTAVLRRESGASISPTEFKTAAEIYFPKPGDTPQVIAQKAATRNTVINNFYQEANTFRPVLPGQIITTQ